MADKKAETIKTEVPEHEQVAESGTGHQSFYVPQYNVTVKARTISEAVAKAKKQANERDEK